MSKPISLGKSLSDVISISEISPDKERYPELCIHDTDEKRLAEMPDSGTATIRYRVQRRTHREERKNGNGKGKEYSCSLVLEILAIDPPAPRSQRKNDNDEARKAFNDYFDKQ